MHGEVLSVSVVSHCLMTHNTLNHNIQYSHIHTFTHCPSSSEKVRESLDYKNIFQHKKLRWDKLFRFHQEMIIKMMADQLDRSTLTWGKYNAIYTIWTKRDKNSDYKKNRLTAWEEMLQTNTYQSQALWELVLKYPHSVIDPCLTYKEKKEFEKEVAANGHEVKTFDDIRIKKIIPDFMRDRFNYFTVECFAYFVDT